MKSYPTKKMNELFEAILSLKNKKEATNFFRDLLTISELEEFSNRFQCVKLLNKNISYIEISQKLGISTATVTRVAHWLNNGMGGYRTIIKRIKK
jgi:TrpR-related protein YerC/YecD